MWNNMNSPNNLGLKCDASGSKNEVIVNRVRSLKLQLQEVAQIAEEV